VTEWQFKKTTTEGSVVLSDPAPYRWTPSNFPTSGDPNPREAAFLLKLGVRDEQRCQFCDLKELVQSDDAERWFKGCFWSVDKKKRTYAVEVFLGMESQMAHTGVRMPQPGTRIHLDVDHTRSAKPNRKNVGKLEGVVVYDALATTSSFICVVDVQGKDLHIAKDMGDYNVFVTYPPNVTPEKPIEVKKRTRSGGKGGAKKRQKKDEAEDGAAEWGSQIGTGT
jgi:hypothetical protein